MEVMGFGEGRRSISGNRQIGNQVFPRLPFWIAGSVRAYHEELILEPLRVFSAIIPYVPMLR